MDPVSAATTIIAIAKFLATEAPDLLEKLKPLLCVFWGVHGLKGPLPPELTGWPPAPKADPLNTAPEIDFKQLEKLIKPIPPLPHYPDLAPAWGPEWAPMPVLCEGKEKA